MNTHSKVTPGTLNHECETLGKERTVKVSVVSDPGEEILLVLRRQSCSHGTRSFSIGLMTIHTLAPIVKKPGGGTGRWVYMVRGCSAHSNYHIHRSSYLRFRADVVTQQQPLDTIEQADAAFRDASRNIASVPRVRRIQWRRQNRL